MISRKLIILFLLISISGIGYGQSLKDLINAAETEFESGNYYAAADLYNKVLDINNTLSFAQYNLAESYRKNRDYKNAGKWYKKIRIDYLEEFPLSGFWYATMMKNQGKYSKAYKDYKKFYKSHRTIDELHTYIIKAKHEYKLCLKLAEVDNKPTNVNINHPDTSINSIYGEFSPVEIDSTIFYSSFKNYNNTYPNLFKSRILNNVNDSVAVAFNSLFYDDNYHYSLSPINKNGELCFTKCPIDNNNSNCTIYIASLVDKQLQDIRALNSDINLKGSNSRHPMLTHFNNKELLIFSSDRPGGFGGYDIWYSYRDEDGIFGKSKNIGRKINSFENEITPFYFPEDTTLFFSSTWHTSYGGYDIFSSYGDFKFWEIPDNIGLPVNSSYDDLYYNFNHLSKNVFFVSNRKGSYAWSNESCCNDIYTYKLSYSLNDSIREERRRLKKIEKIERLSNDLKLLTPLELYFDNNIPDPGSRDSITTTKINDLLNDYFSQKKNYTQEYSKGQSGKNKEIAINEINDFFYEDVETGLDNLYLFVEMLEELLANNKKITLTLKAFASPLNNKEYNAQLAKRRIHSLTNFLIAYNDSAFSIYLDNKSLIINHLSFGESTASESISDDLYDIRNSVYNPSAARERRITIIAITFD